MLSETYSVMHYAGVWGCSRPTAAASLTGSMTASMKKRGRSHRSVQLLLVVTFLTNTIDHEQCISESHRIYYKMMYFVFLPH